MEFSVNHPVIYIVVGIIVALVLAQSIVFLVKAIKRAKAIGMESATIKKTITSSITFTIAPAVAILVGVVSLSVSLGVPLPWLRLSVVGSLSYETVAAGSTLTALGLNMGNPLTDASSFVTIAFVMTIGICLGLFLVPLLTKKIQGGMISLENKDKKWMEIFNNAMFLGMISAFVGYVFCDVTNLFMSDAALAELNANLHAEWLAEFANNPNIEPFKAVTRTACLVPVCVMLVSALVMIILGILSKKTKQRWIIDYALPISLVLGMASAIPLTTWLA